MSNCPGCAEWREKHYPIAAADCPAERALDHSIAKWEGVARLLNGPIGEVRADRSHHDKAYCAKCRAAWWVGSATCALCQAYFDCKGCPIVRVTGKTCHAAFDRFLYDLDAAPMLDLLRRVKEATK